MIWDLWFSKPSNPYSNIWLGMFQNSCILKAEKIYTPLWWLRWIIELLLLSSEYCSFYLAVEMGGSKIPEMKMNEVERVVKFSAESFKNRAEANLFRFVEIILTGVALLVHGIQCHQFLIWALWQYVVFQHKRQDDHYSKNTQKKWIKPID